MAKGRYLTESASSGLGWLLDEAKVRTRNHLPPLTNVPRFYPAEYRPSKFYLLRDTRYVVIDTTDSQLIAPDHIANFDESVFDYEQFGAQVLLLKTGVYELQHDWEVDPGEGGGVPLLSDELTLHWFGNPGQADGPITSSAITIRLIGNAATPDYQSGSRTTWVRVTSLENTQYLQMACEKVVYNNGMEIVFGTASITYLGDLSEPVTT